MNIARITQLSKKAKTVGLTHEEMYKQSIIRV
ncbi:MAG: DUF896 domain-containing protein [Clostridia bacterium]|nr:DUF896 domain-containing protein [Clostridia bacterium]